jgi:hypothetical protein
MTAPLPLRYDVTMGADFDGAKAAPGPERDKGE